MKSKKGKSKINREPDMMKLTKHTMVLAMACQMGLLANAQQKEQLLFHSGFEGGTRIVHRNASSDELEGIDNTVSTPNDWSKFGRENKGYPEAGIFKLYFEGGDSTKRKVRLAPDPKNPANTVLRYTVYESNAVKNPTDTVTFKTRIQAQVSRATPGITKYYQSVRMYFPSSTMQLLDKYPEDITWYSLAEFWNNGVWGALPVPADPFRLTVGMGHKKGAGNPFHFHFGCDDYTIQYKANGKMPEKYIPTKIAGAAAPEFLIPSDTWITVEYYYQEGNWKPTKDRPAGHFYMAVQPDGGKRQVLFNQRVPTMHSHAVERPDGLGIYHPMKFYTNKQIADYMKANHTPMEILWDDLAIYSNKIPNDPELKAALAKP